MSLVKEEMIEGRNWLLKATESRLQLETVPLKGTLVIASVIFFVLMTTLLPAVALIAVSWAMLSSHEFIPKIFVLFLTLLVSGLSLLPKLMSPLKWTQLVLEDKGGQLNRGLLGLTLSHWTLYDPLQVQIRQGTNEQQACYLDLIEQDGCKHSLISNLSHAEAMELTQALQKWLRP